MLETPLISVIVPVYNVAVFLPKALASLQNQSYRNLEFLLLNDGSTDNSENICRQFCQTDERFRLLTKANEGYGQTVNLGLKLAAGSYIAIFEPDDLLLPQMYTKMLAADPNSEAQVIRCSYNLINSRGQYLKDDSFLPLFRSHASGYTNATQVPALASGQPAIWTCLWRHDFLKQYPIFCSTSAGAAFQDIGFYLRAISCATKIKLVPECYYQYRLHGEQSISKDMTDAILYEIAELKKFYKDFFPEAQKIENPLNAIWINKCVEALSGELEKLDLQSFILKNARQRFYSCQKIFLTLPANFAQFCVSLDHVALTKKYYCIREGRFDKFIIVNKKWFMRKYLKLILQKSLIYPHLQPIFKRLKFIS